MYRDSSIIEASTFIYDLVSVSFAYPTVEMHQSLLDGQYFVELAARIQLLPASMRYDDCMEQLDACSETVAANYEDFEAEYIALFEYHKEPDALHLNAHLYSDDEPQPVPVYQRLLAVYRDFELEMNADQYTEQPDHLSIQLEFFAYLFRLLLNDNDARAQQKIETAIAEFCFELEWVKNWAAHLQKRPRHAFYHPLAQLLLLLLATTCEESRRSEENSSDASNS